MYENEVSAESVATSVAKVWETSFESVYGRGPCKKGPELQKLAGRSMQDCYIGC